MGASRPRWLPVPLLLLAMSSAFLAVPVRAELMSSATEKGMLEMIENFMKCRQIPGLTMTLVKGKETKTYPMGVAKIGGPPMKSTTLVNLGSITQSFTAALVAILLQRSGGGITFDMPVEKLIGQELKLSSETITKEVTLRDLLMHRTGLSSGSSAMLTGLPKSMTREELVRNLKELPQQMLFRTEFLFNPFTFTLAGYVGGKLMQSTWEKTMRTHLLDKLGMRSTLVEVDDTLGPEFARAYVMEDDKLVETDQSLYQLGPLAPAGSMYSNAEDMGKALRFFLGDPSLASVTQLPVPALEEIMGPKLLLGLGYRASLDRSSYHWPVNDVNVGYGMGFFRNVYRGYQVPWHAGSIPGYHSIMWMIPEKGVGVFIAINGQKHSDMPLASLQALTYYLSDILMQYDPWINATTSCTFPKPFMDPIEFPDIPFEPKKADFSLEDYLGRFNSPLLGDIVIRKSKINQKALFFQMENMVGELFPEGGNIFRLFLDGGHKFMRSPVKGKNPIPFLRLFFEFKGPQCTGVKVPDSIFGGAPVQFVKTQDKKEEL